MSDPEPAILDTPAGPPSFVTGDIDTGGPLLLSVRSGGRDVSALAATSICDSPECDCTDIDLHLEPHDATWAEPHARISVTIDLQTGQAVDVPDHCTAEFVSSLDTAIDGAALELLRQRWRRVKAHADPEPWRQVDWSWWESGRLVAWTDAFRDDFNLVVRVGDQRYLVEDSHCIAPGCRCHEAVLDFYSLSDSKRAAATIGVNLTVWRPEDMQSRPLSENLQRYWAALQAIPNLREILRDHNKRLQDVGRYLHPLADNRLAPQRQVRTDKVGPNAPCPCASGKKFKKCCGAPGNAKVS